MFVCKPENPRSDPHVNNQAWCATPVSLAVPKTWAATGSLGDWIAADELQFDRETLSQTIQWKAIEEDICNLHTHVHTYRHVYTHNECSMHT